MLLNGCIKDLKYFDVAALLKFLVLLQGFTNEIKTHCNRRSTNARDFSSIC
ncbi:hypothetical protein ALT785_770090 [Alteromonas infernus]